MRRREMMKQGGSQPLPTPIYELPEPTTTASYDTGVKLFNPAITFTILCEAYWTNRNNMNTRSLFALDKSATFRLGYANGFYSVTNGVPSASTSNSYTALVMNASGDAVTKKCGNLQSRDSNTTPHIRRYAVRYNAESFLVEGFSGTATAYNAPTSRWWELSQNISSAETVKLIMNGVANTPQVNIFRVYDSLLTDAQINDFLNGVID